MYNTPFGSSSGPLYQNAIKCSALDMEMNVHSHANKTQFHKKGCALGLILKVKVFGTRKWLICNVNVLNGIFPLIVCFCFCIFAYALI